MALTFGDFLSIFTTNDPSGGRAIKATFDTGIDDAANYLTKNDPAGGRAIKVVNVGAPLGPQFWTEAYNAGTQATSSWTATGAATNINAAIVPKGTGAIVADIPDGTATGGNARGSYAVDLQMIRSAATQVASGVSSFVGGGQNNTANAEGSSVVGGYQNTASKLYSAVVGGTFNTASGFYSFVGGGYGCSAIGSDSSVCVGGVSNSSQSQATFVGAGTANTANNQYATITGGQSNTASGQHSFVGGGQTNTASSSIAVIGGGQNNTASGVASIITGGLQGTASLYGQQAHASGRFAANGDAQAHELIWRRAITGTTAAELFLDGASVQAILPGTNSVWNGIIDVSAVCTSTGDGTTTVGHVEATSYKVTIKRIGTTTSLVGTVQEIGTTNSDNSMTSGVFTIDNDDTNEALRIQFTPPTTAGSTTVIRVVATFRGTQIQY